MSKERLRPCPFCGGKARLYVYDDLSGLSPEIACINRPECTAKMMKYGHEGDVELLIKAWNRRPK